MKPVVNAYITKIMLILFLVSVPPFLIGSIYSATVFMKEAKSLVNSKNDNELIRTGTLMDQSLREITNAAFSMVSDSQYGRLNSVVDQSRALSAISRAGASNPIFHSIWLYNDSSRYMLVSNYGIVRNAGDPPYRSIKEQLSGLSVYEMKITPVTIMEQNGRPQYVASLLSKLPIVQDTQSYLIFNLDMETLYNNFLRQLNVDDHIYNYYLTDKEGTIVYSKDPARIFTKVQESAQLGGKLQINRYRLELLPWILVSEVNVYELYGDVNKQRNEMIALSVIAIGLLTSFVVIGGLRLYEPIRRILVKVGEAVNDKIGKREEFEFIGSAVEQVARSNDRLRARLQESEDRLRTTLLKYMAKHSHHEGRLYDIDTFLHDYDDPMVVVIVIMNDPEELVADWASRFRTDTIEESANEQLVLFRLDHTDVNRFIIDLLSCMSDQQLQRATISIGGIYPVERLHNSYMEALYAYNMGRIYANHTNIFCYNKLPMDYTREQPARAAIEELELAVRQQDEKTYSGLLESMFADQLSVTEYNFNLYRTISFLIKLYDRESADFLQEINELVATRGIMNTVTVKQFFYDKFRSYQSEYRTEGYEQIRKIDDYIVRNYSQSFSLDDIADHVGYTKQYFCSVFKQHYKMTLVEYLNEFRIGKAKELLADSSATISEIGSRVGFNSNSYFTRIFKQSTGITPSEYRGLSKNRQSDRHVEGSVDV